MIDELICKFKEYQLKHSFRAFTSYYKRGMIFHIPQGMQGRPGLQGQWYVISYTEFNSVKDNYTILAWVWNLKDLAWPNRFTWTITNDKKGKETQRIIVETMCPSNVVSKQEQISNMVNVKEGVRIEQKRFIESKLLHEIDDKVLFSLSVQDYNTNRMIRSIRRLKKAYQDFLKYFQ